eukprot:s491_g26.t1
MQQPRGYPFPSFPTLEQLTGASAKQLMPHFLGHLSSLKRTLSLLPCQAQTASITFQRWRIVCHHCLLYGATYDYGIAWNSWLGVCCPAFVHFDPFCHSAWVRR